MQRWLPFIIFIVILGFARIISAYGPESLANLQPYGALFFCGMACFGMRGIIAPAAAWLISYPMTSMLNGYGWSAQLLVVIVGFAAMVGIGRLFREKGAAPIFAGSLLAAATFYMITNTLSWAFDPGYAKSLQGLGQALWTGLPGFEPTWMFFRNSLMAQALFTGVFLLAYGLLPSPFRSKESRELLASKS